MATYAPAKVEEWVNDDGGDTAICPLCAVDSVIGDASGVELSQQFLLAMHERWFKR